MADQIFYFEEARAQVRGPAIGLIVTGIIHCAFFPILLIVFLGYLVVEVRPAPQSSEIYKHFEAEPSGRSFERVTEPKPEGNHD